MSTPGLTGLMANGKKYEITKKQPIVGKDLSQHSEETIFLTQAEFESLSQVEGKPVRKIRYMYEWQGMPCEVDVFQDDLLGLILTDFEFKTEEEMAQFKMPSFCLAEVTGEEFPAGGMLAGKKYKDIEKNLEKFGYRKLA